MSDKSILYRLYSIINRGSEDDLPSVIYDWIMIIMIVLSIIPLAFARSYQWFRVIEWITLGLFTFDYLARWLTAPIALGKGWRSYLLYPFTFMAIVDALSILPVVGLLSSEFKLFRLFRLFRIIRFMHLTRYSKHFELLFKVLENKRDVLISVMWLAVIYVIVTALLIYNVEPRVNALTGEPTFSSFFDALYWATVTLTSVGYGDITPVSAAGKVIAMVSSLFGIAIIAMPASIITAGYMEVVRKLGLDDRDRRLTERIDEAIRRYQEESAASDTPGSDD